MAAVSTRRSSGGSIYSITPAVDLAPPMHVCVVDAFRSSRTFVASYRVPGTDRQVSRALVCDGVRIWNSWGNSDVSGLGSSIDQSDCASTSVQAGEAAHYALPGDDSSKTCPTRLCGPVPRGSAPCGD